ncbi:PNPLA domain-containing protein [Fusarium falciforme]|uniref:PNPLA domain-containing protein n=1 Tax=Fusarium falciforme TaxID=195108 RepID=UPI00230029D8|nr:PNPLA domain-containing protein [Fusarium falciforme]WAO96561.1 PNPLA domain-containing protein [Fusarium falciforme]
MVYSPATKHPNGARLLALDGGGVRGVMALEVLAEVMDRVRRKKGLTEPCRPADYFELAAGTSTGGIIGIMLFRLRMTAEDAIKQYDVIASQVFSPKVYGWNIGWMPTFLSSTINNSKTLVQSSRFDDASLKKAVDGVVEKFGLDENDRRLKGDASLQHPGSARIFCCTTAQNRAETVLLRTYKDNNIYCSSKTNDTMALHQDKMTISLATRATSAAPTYFPEVIFPEGTPKSKDNERLVFWDGGLLNNNPIDQLWYSRYELAQPHEPPPAISCVISLGTGYTKPDSPSESWFQLVGVAAEVMEFSTNTNAKAKDFTRHMTTLNLRGEHKNTKYVRLNPSLGKSEIGLADYTKMKELKAMAQKYLTDKRNQEWINKAVDAICA